MHDPTTPVGALAALRADLYRTLPVRRDALYALIEAAAGGGAGGGIEPRADAGGMFYRREEIVATYHMLRALLLYPDDMILSTALRTPYLREAEPSLKEQEILQYRPSEGTPLTDWFERSHPRYAEALDALRRSVRIDAVPQILAELYRSFGITEYYTARRDIQAVENLERLRELARSMFQNEQALTLRQFDAAHRNSSVLLNLVPQRA